MAQRGAPKASKKSAGTKAAGKRNTGPADGDARSKLGTGSRSRDAGGLRKAAPQGSKPKAPALKAKELTLECARLKEELEQARDEIKVLKGRQDFVLDRIDWAIDSLHTLLEDE